MTALIICLLLLLALTAVAMIKCRLCIRFLNFDLQLQLQCLGFRHSLKNEKMQEHSNGKELSEAEHTHIVKSNEGKPKRGINYRVYLPYWREILELTGRVLTAPTVELLQIEAEAGGNDAAQCAMNYGRLWAVIGMVLPVVETNFRVDKKELSIHCNYEKDSVEICAEIRLSLRVYEILLLAWEILLFLLRLRREIKYEEKAVPEK